MGRRKQTIFLEEMISDNFSNIPKKKLTRYEKMKKKKAKKNREFEFNKRYREYDYT